MDIVNLIFRADTSQLDAAQRKINDVGGAMEDAAGKVNKLTTSLTPLKAGFTALVAALGVATLKSWFDTVASGAADLNNLATKTGLAVEQLSVMKTIAAASGTSIDEVANAVIKLQRSQGAAAKSTTTQAEAFRQLGIDAKTVAGDTGNLLGVVADKLATVEDGWQKNTVVMALFGKQGTAMLEFLGDYAERGETVAKVTSDMAAQAESYERGMRKLSVMGNQFKEVFGMGVLPVADALVKQFVKLYNETGKLSGETRELMKNNVTQWAWDAAAAIAGFGDLIYKAANFVKGMTFAAAGAGVAIAGLFDILTSRPQDVLAKVSALKTTIQEMGAKGDEAFGKAFGDSTPLNDFVTKARQQAATTESPKTKIKGIQGVDPDGREKQLKEEERLIDRANALFVDQVKIMNDLKGDDGDRVKLSAQFNELIAKAEESGNKRLALELQNKKLSAEFLEDMNNQTKQRKLQEEAAIRLNTSQRELNNLTKQWAETVKNVTYPSLIRTSKSMQEQAADQFKRDYDGLKTTGTNKVEDLRSKAKDARLKNKGNEADSYDKQADEALKALNEDLDALNAKYEDSKAKSNDAFAGMKAGAKSFSDSLPTLANGLADITERGIGSFADSLTNLMSGGSFKFKDFIKTMIQQLIKLCVQLAIAQALMSSMGMASPVGSAAPTSAGTASVANVAAKGAVYGPSGLLMSANGNVFDGPTLHMYGTGKLGVLGEAGPEAVMPLTRGADGKLGVAASGGSSGSSYQINSNVTINMQGDAGNAQDRASLMKQVLDATNAQWQQNMETAMRSGGTLNAVR